MTVDITSESITKGKTVPTMNDLGEAIGALPKPAKERPVVSCDIETMDVWGLTPLGRISKKRFGRLLHFKEAPNVTPTGGRYVSRRVTVRRADGTLWVGQFRNGATVVQLRPDPR